MKILKRNFYNRPAEIVAKELLGKYLVYQTGKTKLVAKIVETEAYHQDDPASHSYRGKITPRNQPMFGPPGHAYVYFVYGSCFCFNVVTDPYSISGAVLIRALEPISGIEIMKKNRLKQSKKKAFTKKELTNGPGKLAQAFNITKKINNWDLTKSNLKIYDNNEKNFKVITTTRIGLSQAEHELLRFYIQDNPFVSVK